MTGDSGEDDVVFKVKGDFESFEQQADEVLRRLSENDQQGGAKARIMRLQAERLKIEKDLLDLESKREKTQKEDLKFQNQKLQFMQKVVRLEEQSNNLSDQRQNKETKSQAEAREIEETKKKKREERNIEITQRVLGGLVDVAGVAQQAGFQGFQDSGVMNIIGSVLGKMPVLGGALQGAAGIFSGDMFRGEQRAILRLRMEQMLGTGGRGMFEGDDPSKGGLIIPRSGQSLHERMGLGAEDRARLLVGLGRAGTLGDQQYGAVAGLEGFKLLGGEGMGLLGASRRAGVTDSKQQLDILGDAIGIAMASKLDEGRWGELLTVLARSASSVTTGFLNQKNLIDQESFIQNLGPAFQGQTGSSNAARAALDSLRTGQAGPASNAFGIMAGMRAGESYAESWFKQQTGQRTEAEVLQIVANMDGVKQAWQGAPPGFTPDKGVQLLVLSEMFPNINPGIMLSILDGHFGNARNIKADGRVALAGIGQGSFIREGDAARQIAAKAAKGTRVNAPASEEESRRSGEAANQAVTDAIMGPTRAFRPQGGKAESPFAWTQAGPGALIRWPYADDGFVTNVSSVGSFWSMTVKRLATGAMFFINDLEVANFDGGSPVHSGDVLGRKRRSAAAPGAGAAAGAVNQSTGLGAASSGLQPGMQIDLMIHDARVSVEKVFGTATAPMGNFFGGRK